METKGPLFEKIIKGNFFSKQLHCGMSLIAWSHSTRFKLARLLLLPFSGNRLLDYGCGDGTFLALNQDLYKTSIGVDISADQIKNNSERFASLNPQIRFLTVDGLAEEISRSGLFNLVTCMETLEHCPMDVCQNILSLLRSSLKPDGTAFITVPIEIGPSLIIKQIFRHIAGWRNLGDYKYMETYSFLEFWKMVFATEETQITRPQYTFTHPTTGVTWLWHGHKGFNWRILKKWIQREFKIERIVFSPIPFTKSGLNSQVFFICKPIPKK